MVQRVKWMAMACAVALVGTVQAAPKFDAPLVVSTQVPDGNNAFKAKMVSQAYKSSTTLPTYDVRATVMVYVDNAESSGQDIWIARSADKGVTWTQARITQNAGTLVTLVGPDGLTYVLPSTNGKPNIYAPATGVINTSAGANMLVTWSSSYCRDLQDSSRPSPAQKVNLNLDTGPAPYKCLWTARSVDGGLSWNSQQLTDGAMDVDEDVPAGYTTSTLTAGGFGIIWQADPAGLQQGGADGPGDGASGASVSKGTNIWYSFLSKASFEAGAAFPTPSLPLSDNDPVTNARGASRPNLFIVGGTAIVAYEETKGDSDLQGKQVIYHSFPYSAPNSVSSGKVVSDPALNARRVRILSQGDVSAGTSPLRVVLIYRQSQEVVPGAPAEVVTLRGLKTTELGSTGFRPEDIEPFTAALNLSNLVGAKKADNSLAQRGVLRGSKVAVGFDYTPNMNLANAVPPTRTYNFYFTTSLDSGASWSAPENVSRISDYTVRVVEPRMVGTPGTILNPDGTATGNPADVQAADTFVLAFGTETNAAISVPLDIWVARTTDFGATRSAKRLLAEGLTSQSEAQLRTTPDGVEVQSLWMQFDGIVSDVYFRGFRY